VDEDLWNIVDGNNATPI